MGANLDAEWEGPDGAVGREVATVSEQTLNAYREAPRLVEEHHNLELAAVDGGYGRRQLFELIQNGADELLDQHGRIQVVLTEDALYCANQGNALTVEGIRALQFSHLSSKKGVEIGRFGLGFKSVLGITRAPEIFSRTGSVRFDPELARASIQSAIGHDPAKVPTLRIGVPLDPRDARESDPILSDLTSWATTVVRLRRDTEDSSWLEGNVDRFPAEFLLFSPHVEQLILEDTARHVRRVIGLRPADDGSSILIEGNSESRWRVFHTTHKPSRRARLDAGRHADRDEIPLAWAVPTQRRRRGEFWAFFPTLDTTTLSGVLNAPWKLNEDRTRIIDGTFNKELLEAACSLVMTNLDGVVGTDDPGLVLDLLPGRGKEILGWADETVTKTINADVGHFPCVPDQEGELDLPSRLKVHPAGIPREALDLWSGSPRRPTDWAHPSIETRERRPRVDAYMAATAAVSRSAREWLEALIGVDVAEGSAAATLAAAAALGAEDGLYDHDIRNARIVLDESGALRAVGEALFVRAPLPLEVDAIFVDDDVAQRPGVAMALEQLGVHRIEPARLLHSLLKEHVAGWEPSRWDLLWELARQTDPLETKRAFDAAHLGRSRVQVRTAAGSYVRLVTALLPGTVVPQLSSDDGSVLLDTAFHSKEAQLLQVLGATPGPTHNGGGQDEPWYSEYEKAALIAYLESIKDSGASPNREYLRFAALPFAGPLTPLRKLSDGGKARFVAALLSVAQDLEPWTFGHTTQARYPRRAFPHPVVWMVRRYGMLETSLGIHRPEEAVGPAMSPLSDVLPVARVRPDVAQALELPNSVGELKPGQWTTLLDNVRGIDRDGVVGLAYLAAATNDVPQPDELWCRAGRVFDLRPAATIAVTADEHLARIFSETSQPFIRVARDEEAAALVQAWGLRSAEEAVRTEVSWSPAGEPEPLVDAFPTLRMRLDDHQRRLQLVPCDELTVETFTDAGRVSADKPMVLKDESIYFRAALGERRILESLSSVLSLGLGPADVEAILRNLDANRVRQLRAEIRKAADNPDRLLLAVGAQSLRRRIPRALIEAVEKMHGALDDRATAELALVVHGVRTLQEHAEDLEARGLTPPARWGGSRRAVEFARQLGFGNEFAGFDSPAPGATLEVEGRPELGPLHDYQQIVVGEIRSLLRGEEGLRGLLSLPTGAGKTRVTIEALVDALAARELESPVLWVAQTEELCEQAIQTWSEIWRAFGPTRRLTVSRLYSRYEAEEVELGEQVVVATVQKLDAGVFEKREYEWLSRSTCVVVDEAHSSVGQQYTRLLDWQGMGRGRERAPLVGLTATPFRGTNVEETRRLVSRYGGRRLDLLALGGADAYPHLQTMGILSQVEHELLPGSDLALSPDELRQLERLRFLPATASRNLGADVERNRTLLDSVLGLDPTWPVLLFAASVEHAQTMAALLVREGVAAAAITGETDKAARRHYIERFRAGELRVLTNFNVLTAGFDAPRVRAVYVARPTYSANQYQQMIGRGLRGPLNGGTPTCLLVNVADNVLQYGEKLAFHEFDYLWSGDTATV